MNVKICGTFTAGYRYILLAYQFMFWGTRWRSWLRHRTTSLKVAGSIPEGVIGIFH
jgi:hypothetical protein